jgi:Uma2 family endonuclease
MAMPAHSPEWTLEMLHALPDDGNRYELVDGELLVSPSPSMGHQRVVAELNDRLRAWGRQHALEVFFAPCAVTFSPRRELQPDILVVPFKDGRRISETSQLTSLVLAVEVLSPSTARHDRVTKRRVYLEQGVAEYWIVDPDGRAVERWRSGEARPEILDDTLRWTPPGRESTFELNIVEFFREALD